MGLIKSEIFTEDQNELATIAKVLGHPARIAILQHLFKIKGCVCGDLVNEIGLAQATVSQHLKELKSVGLIQGKISGTSVCYCVNSERWGEISLLINEFLMRGIHCCNTDVVDC
jgi:predicted transcriptional regulator